MADPNFSIDKANAPVAATMAIGRGASGVGTAYPVGDPRNAIAAAQANYDAVQSLMPTAIPAAPIRPEGGFTNPGDAQAYRSAMKNHNQALLDAKNYAETSKYMHDALHQAQVHADAGDFHAAFAKIPLDDPDMAAKASAILAKSPGAASDPSVQESLNMRLAANQRHSALQEQHAKEAEAHQETGYKIMAQGLSTGILSDKDFAQNYDGKPGTPLPSYMELNSITGKPQLNIGWLQKTIAERQGMGLGTKADKEEMATALQKFNAMNAALKDPDLDPDSEEAQGYKLTRKEALKAISAGTAPAKTAAVAGAAPAATPAGTPPPTQSFVIKRVKKKP
jgi:hypothetical protein